ncbi:hypothetical protein J6590_001503 [Homalodisca vitripennis]|nr:hypothetical protein J6590_001503 [Homalodisca vitripennis]
MRLESNVNVTMHHYCRYRNNRATRCCPATLVSAQRNNPLLPQTSSCSFVIGQQDAVLPLTCRLSVTTLSSHRPQLFLCHWLSQTTTRCCPATHVSAQLTTLSSHRPLAVPLSLVSWSQTTTRCCPATHVSAHVTTLSHRPLAVPLSLVSWRQQDAVLPLTCRLSVTTLSSHRPLAVPLSLVSWSQTTTRCCPATLVSAQRNNPLLPQTSSCSFVIVGVKRECNDASLLSIPEQQDNKMRPATLVSAQRNNPLHRPLAVPLSLDNKMLSCHSRVGSA